MQFSVPEMSCGHCTAAIEKAMNELDPAATVNCDLTTRRVTINTSLTKDDVGVALKQAGYESELIAA